ncbi:MAG: PHB depolymerase family esterase [Ramlibacter sp.]|nr:PHB depolymerase family esterase [Ramlibacter sp.]
MNPPFQQLLSEATRLTRIGDLQAATAAIQAALGGGAGPAPAQPEAAFEVIDVPAREVSGAPRAEARAQRELEPEPEREPEVHEPARFVSGSSGSGAARRDYKLYIPPGAGARPLPLVLMLHGCTQDPDDFAKGTGMNEAALAQGFFVLYPAQSRKANPQGCWNWFKHSHQQRGRGEPEILVAMTREVMARHPIDPQRVYVAGLSAGGAMAAILGCAYPELFAAVGVHSGLAAGAATDLPGALAAMRGGAPARSTEFHSVPTIVFHGDADGTVHPSNGDQVVAACAGRSSSVQTEQVRNGSGRACTRRVHTDAVDGRILAEHWLVHGAPHAWSGGSPRGSYTDSRGPDATAEMARFFLQHSQPPRQ